VDTSVFAGIYTTGFSAVASAPTFSSLTNAQTFLDAYKKYGKGLASSANADGVPQFPHCVWSWEGAQILEQAFQKMTAPTRDAFMTALRSISSFQADFLISGITITTNKNGSPAVSGVVGQKFNGKGYANVTTLG